MTTTTNPSAETITNLAIFLLERTGATCGTWTGRLTAAEQRAICGAAPFGRAEVTIDGMKETIRASKSVCFGTDRNTRTATWVEFEKEIAAGAQAFLR